MKWSRNFRNVAQLQKFMLDSSSEELVKEGFNIPLYKYQIYFCATQMLKWREKRQRLSWSEKLYIYNLVVNKNAYFRTAALNFILSITTIRSIIKKEEIQLLYRASMYTNTKKNLMFSSLIQKWIETFVSSDRNLKT